MILGVRSMKRKSDFCAFIILASILFISVFCAACIPSSSIVATNTPDAIESDNITNTPKITPAPTATAGKSPIRYSADFEFYTENGEAVITGYFGYNGTVIPAELDGCPVTKIDDWAFYNTSISCSNIPDSVTCVGDSAFSYCLNIKNLEFSEGLINIGNNAFSHCLNRLIFYK